MARQKTYASRPFIEKDTDAFSMGYASAEVETVAGINKGYINRLLKEEAIIPNVGGGGAGTNRRFSLWNLIQFKAAGELLPFFRFEVVADILKQISLDLDRGIVQFAGEETLYKFIYKMPINNGKMKPFQPREEEPWEKQPCIYGVRLLEKSDGTFYPFTQKYNPNEAKAFKRALDMHDWFNKSVVHFINLHVIARKLLNDLINYDQVRKENQT